MQWNYFHTLNGFFIKTFAYFVCFHLFEFSENLPRNNCVIPRYQRKEREKNLVCKRFGGSACKGSYDVHGFIISHGKSLAGVLTTSPWFHLR